MSAAGKTKDALGPIEFIISLALALTGALLLVGVAAMAFGGAHTHATLGVWGDPYPCVQVPQSGLDIGYSSGTGSTTGTFVQGLKSGAHLGVPDAFTICADHMSGTNRALFSVPVLLDVMWSIGFLALTLALIRRARRRGLFTHEVARATTRLGWFILGGWAVVNLCGGVLRAVGISHLASGYSVITGIFANLSWNWAIVIAGFGVISIGRVMQRTVPMQEEIEATV